jgi:poly(hydroxyalkanoate) depolymerase family esterase
MISSTCKVQKQRLRRIPRKTMDWTQITRLLRGPTVPPRRSRGKWVKGSAHTAAGSRNFRLWVPATYDARLPCPLVMMLHGCQQGPEDMVAISGMNAVANRNNILVVYPEQSADANPMRCWNWFDPQHQSRGAGEPSILAAVIDKVQSSHNVDPDRVYVAGLSAGAAMAVVLGATYPDLFTAIGVIAGLEFGAGTSPATGHSAMQRGGPDPLQQGRLAFQAMNAGLTSTRKRRMPVIAFQGTADPYISPVNIDQIIAQWGKTNDYLGGSRQSESALGRTGELTKGKVSGGYSFHKYTYEDGAGRLLMEKWMVEGLGHAWPGSRVASPFADPKGPNASAEMWRFFCETTLDPPDPVTSWRAVHGRLVSAFRGVFQFVRDRYIGEAGARSPQTSA